MTTFGIDVSANQGPIDWAKVKAAGVQFAIGRATLGVGTDAWIARYLKGMRAAGILPGAYAYLYHDEPSTAARQADHFMDVIGDPNGLLVALDAEQVLTSDYARVRRDDAERFADRWYARYPGHQLLAYCPGWFWSSGPPSAFGPLWNSHYVGLRGASLSHIYADVPSSYWAGYGDWPRATILQFTSGALVPGISGVVDGNAYGGTRAQLATYAITAPTGGGIQPVPEGPPVGLQFRITERVTGTAKVAGSDHAIIRVDTGQYVPVPAGQEREVAARITLTINQYGKAAGTKGYLVGNTVSTTPDQSIAAFMLEGDGTFTPTPAAAPVDCTPLVEAATIQLQEELDAEKARAVATAAVLREQATLLGG